MTTKKKTSTKDSTKSKSVAEPATATKTVKPSKKELARAAQAEAAQPVITTVVVAAPPTPKAESPVAPTVAAALATQPKATPADLLKAAPKAESPVSLKQSKPAATKPVLTIGMFQKALYNAGFYGGHWDGQYGPLTKQAVCRFQASLNLPVDGEPTAETLAALGL